MKQGNKTKIATVVCWCVVAVAMAGLAAWVITGSLFGIPTGFRLGGLSIGGIENLAGKYELRGTETTPVTGVDSLIIDWVAGAVTVTPYDGAEIEFKEYAQRDLSDREQMYISVSGGIASVQFIESGHISRMPPKRLEIRVPRELCGSMEMLGADAASADINITGVNAVKIMADTASGNIELTGIRADDLTANSASGDITVTGAVCGELHLGSVSGNLKTTDTRAELLSTDSASGDQRLSGEFKELGLDSVSGDITVENGNAAAGLRIGTASGTQTASGAFRAVKSGSVSGDVRITSVVVPEELDIDTASGNVTLTLPNEGGIALEYSTASGILKNDIPVTLKSGRASLRISTVSGDVRILEL